MDVHETRLAIRLSHESRPYIKTQTQPKESQGHLDSTFYYWRKFTKKKKLTLKVQKSSDFEGFQLPKVPKKSTNC